MGVARVLLIIIGAVLSILGTYVFSLYGFLGYGASGVGFIMNAFVGNVPPYMMPSLISDPTFWATTIGMDVWLYWILLILFIIFLAAGALQLVGLKSRVVGVIFSLFPLAVGLMFILVFFTEILGPISGSFAALFLGEQIGGFLPYLVDLGAFMPAYSGVGIGSFFLVGGGFIGFVGSILPKD